MMSPAHDKAPTTRFTGLADCYARFRPSYPDAAIQHALARCGLRPGCVLVDVGCGTGISSRLFAMQGLQVIGIEPNADMRRQADATPSPEGVAPPTYRDGRAEATGLPRDFADGVLAAQAFHWFEPGKALREFARVLKERGWVILMWNERDEGDAFTAEYGSVIRSTREAETIEMPRGRAGQPLLTCSEFRHAQRHEFTHRQELDEEGLLGRAFSASYAPREPGEAERFAASLRAVFQRFAKAGRVTLRYRTSVYTAQRPGVVQAQLP